MVRLLQSLAFFVVESDTIKVAEKQRYVSRAGLKRQRCRTARLDFRNKVVLDVGSTIAGGFTDYSLQHGAKKVFAVDGTGIATPKACMAYAPGLTV